MGSYSISNNKKTKLKSTKDNNNKEESLDSTNNNSGTKNGKKVF